MSEYKSKKARTEHSEHSENCGCESVTGVTEEDTQEREWVIFIDKAICYGLNRIICFIAIPDLHTCSEHECVN